MVMVGATFEATTAATAATATTPAAGASGGAPAAAATAGASLGKAQVAVAAAVLLAVVTAGSFTLSRKLWREPAATTPREPEAWPAMSTTGPGTSASDPGEGPTVYLTPPLMTELGSETVTAFRRRTNGAVAVVFGDGHVVVLPENEARRVIEQHAGKTLEELAAAGAGATGR
jgi:hypothetical protein